MSEQQNNSEDLLRQKIRSLDNEPPQLGWHQDALWEEIRRQQGGHSKRWIMRVAASLLLLVVASLLIYNTSLKEENLAYSVEQAAMTNAEEPDLSLMEADAMEFIEHNCFEALVVCNKPEFKALKADLESLQSDIDQLNEMIEKYGEDPVIIKSRTQIEDLKNEITNKLVQMVMS